MDLIDREQALGCFWVYEDGDETEMPAYDRLQALPIVAEVEDCISRQAALNSPVTMVSEGLDWIPAYHIKDLPSAQPEEIALHESCADCPLYDKDRHSCPRFNKVIPETLRELQSAQPDVPDTNVGDTISRQNAINELWKALYEYEDKTEKQFQESEDLDVADWILHRIFVQNMNDIDRQTILALPSAEPDERMLHESCTDCPLYDKDRHSCPRFNKVIPETLREVRSEQQWIPCSKKMPEYDKPVLLSTAWGKTEIGFWTQRGWMIVACSYREFEQDAVDAWMPLPEPYERRQDESN